MKKPIAIELLPDADNFIDNLDEAVRNKFYFSMAKVKLRLPARFKKMPGTDDIWEFYESDGKSFYRLFAFWDNTKSKETLILCTHGVTKEKNKTPPNVIKKAEAIKKEYFDKS